MALYGLTAENVLAEAGHPSAASGGFADATAQAAHITTFLLPAAKTAIEQYLRRTYTDADVPDQVKHAALRVAALGLMKIGIKKSGSLIRVGDYVVELSNPVIFTPEIREELKDFIAPRTPHVIATPYETKEIQYAWQEDGSGRRRVGYE